MLCVRVDIAHVVDVSSARCRAQQRQMAAAPEIKTEDAAATSDSNGAVVAVARSKRAKTVTSGGRGGFARPVYVSPELSEFLGGGEYASRTAVRPTGRPARVHWTLAVCACVQTTKALWDHIKSNGLQDSADRRYILTDAALRKLGLPERVHMFTMCGAGTVARSLGGRRCVSWLADVQDQVAEPSFPGDGSRVAAAPRGARHARKDCAKESHAQGDRPEVGLCASCVY